MNASRVRPRRALKAAVHTPQAPRGDRTVRQNRP
ncbi:hypothetical protein STRAU_3521 [Streptomyces aurantiacus JA 4570]|uniref:Uncharacterized protein n=1 Tax=Streptomyces aurantiacus JA 4570 TaxID=1286094 RepID=S4APQ7_9ACTN|nr:hypothetical protein STRAU_3521 [Streptomyces aurantiacus JA 4570]